VANGDLFSSFAFSSDMTTNAHAPSFIPGAFPAVIVPSGSKAGRRDDNFSTLVSLRGASSVSRRLDLLFVAEPLLLRFHQQISHLPLRYSHADGCGKTTRLELLLSARILLQLSYHNYPYVGL